MPEPESKQKRYSWYFGTLQIHMDVFLTLRAQELSRIKMQQGKRRGRQ